MSKYASPPRLIRATGKEDFEVVSGGEKTIEHPEAGEVVWCDDVGVTCRRWNWRQCKRTALKDETRSVVFFFDVLEPMSDEALRRAADELERLLKGFWENVRIMRRIIGKEDGMKSA